MFDLTQTRGNKELYDIITPNVQKIGNKYFANVPVQLIFVDPEYQRVETRSKERVTTLAQHWCDAKMDPIRLVAHPDENRFACVDGLGRLTAKMLLNASNTEESFASLTIEAEVIFNAPLDPIERRKYEAELFATQLDYVEDLKHYQKHKANILRGVRENIILQGICEEYNVSVVPHGRGRVSNGVLGDFKGALNICKKPNGGDILRNIFKIISRAGWDESPSAYSKYVIQSIRKILETYPSNSDEIVEFLGDKFRGIEPLILKAEGNHFYPERGCQETRCTLYLQDIVCDALGLDRDVQIVTPIRNIA